MASKTIQVVIAGDASKLTSALKSAGVEVTAFADETEKSGGKLNGLKTAAAAAATGGLLVLGDALKTSVDAAEQQQAAQARMAAAFKASGQPISEYSSAIEDAEGKGRTLGFTDEEVMSSLTNLITATHNGKTAMTDLGTAEDLARAKHESLDAASSTLQKAMTGSTRAASQLGITIIPVTTNMQKLTAEHLKAGSAQAIEARQTAMLADKQATAQEVISKVSSAVAGQAETFSKTGVGSMQAYHAEMTDVEAEIGTALIPILAKLGQVLVSVIQWTTKHKTEAEALGIAIGVAVIAVKGYTFATEAASVATEDATVAQTAFNAVMDGNPIALVAIALVALGAAIVVAYNKVSWFRDGVNEAFTVVKDAAKIGVDAFNTAKDAIGGALTTVKNAVDTVVGFIGNSWRTLAPILLLPIAPLILIVTHFTDVKNAVTDVWTAIKAGVGDAVSAVTSVGNTIAQLPGKVLAVVGSAGKAALSLGSHIADGVVNAVESAVGTVISDAESLGGKIVSAIVAGIEAMAGDIANAVKSAVGHAISSLPGKALHAVESIIPGFAGGTPSAPGGWAIVGERGPELVNLPRGSSVTPAAQTRQMLSGGSQMPAGSSQRPINMDFRGSKFNSPQSARTMADRVAYRLQFG